MSVSSHTKQSINSTATPTDQQPASTDPISPQVDASNPAEPRLDETASSAENTHLHTFDMSSSFKKSSLPLQLGLGIVAIVLGITTGAGVFQLQANQGGSSSNLISGDDAPIAQVATDRIENGDVFGSSADDFVDTAQGYLEDGGLNGEGSHSLLRPGGDSQTIYLTSSITDLDDFIGMEIKIWGETFAGQQAGWLMDVGRVEVLNVDGKSPALNVEL